jgi:uncharacterized protein YjbI with pentapeptide repeats
MEWITSCETEDRYRSYDFRGFVFPNVELKGKKFTKPVLFDDCTFLDSAIFENSDFGQTASFNNTHFLSRALFTGTTFSGEVHFQNVRFTGYTNFDNCQFRESAYFQHAWFAGDAYFRRVSFEWDAFFNNARFEGRTNFRNSKFRGYGDFINTRFLNRLKLLGTEFHDELRMSHSYLSFLKNLVAVGVNFEGAVLEETHFWGIDEIQGYSFRNSFLLSVSFANKNIIDCDFTGAVFKSVLTEGWKPDDKTLRNTQYIYTDYTVERAYDEEGMIITLYKPIEETRVPADGIFGQGEHTNFSLSDYLREPLKWSLALNLPPLIRSGVLNYLQFFTDFIQVTEGIPIELRTRKEGNKIRVDFIDETQNDKELVQERFRNYLDNAAKEFRSLDIHFNNPQVTDVEKELFLIRYEHQINTLRTELSYTERLLKKEEEKNQQLLQVINHLSREPRKFLGVGHAPSPQICEVPIFFLTADLKGYSKATQENKKLYSTIQSYLFEQKLHIEEQAGCELVKLEGDCIKAFFREGVRLVWLAKNLIHELERLKYDQTIDIDGFRVVLGYGSCYREQRGADVDFSGDAIVETVRVDQPMKRYIQEHNEEPNQIWCTEAFHKELIDKHEHIHFESLPKLNLDKEYSKELNLYRVVIR